MTKTTNPERGTLLINGSASSARYTQRIQLEVGPANGEGGMLFGADTDLWVGTSFGDETLKGTVQVGGIQAHDTELGRWRANALLLACDIIDALTALVNGDAALSCTEALVVAGQRFGFATEAQQVTGNDGDTHTFVDVQRQPIGQLLDRS
jgi:hypothetical protein